MKQKATNKLSTGLFVLIVLGILVLVNLIGVRVFGRLDLTEDGRYSLSDASKNMMKNLDDKVHAKAYFTAELPAPYNSHTRFVRDLFEEYAAYSRGNFQFEFIDPGEDETVRQEMMLLGIPPVQIQEIRNDKFEVKQAFLGIVFYYADKKETIPVVRSTHNLEYEITSTIRKLTADNLKTVAFVQGHGEPVLREEIKKPLEYIEKNFKIVPLNLKEEDEIAPEIEALIIISPKEKFDDKELFLIDQFIMKGKTVAFFLDAVDIDLQRFQAKNIELGIDRLIEHYGITLNKNLVVDAQNKRINVASQQGMYRIQNIVNYPLFPVITNFDEESTLMQKIEALPLPFVSTLDISSDSESVDYTVLGRTSPRSWLQTGAYQINPMSEYQPEDAGRQGPFPVMAMAKGSFTSYYADKLAQANPDKPYLSDPSRVLTKSEDTRILVFGDGSFAKDEFSEPTSVVFFADCVDWLLQDDALISIRGRGITDKPIAELENWERSAVKYLNMIGIPFLFILFGLIRWTIRRAKRKGFEL